MCRHSKSLCTSMLSTGDKSTLDAFVHFLKNIKIEICFIIIYKFLLKYSVANEFNPMPNLPSKDDLALEAYWTEKRNIQIETSSGKLCGNVHKPFDVQIFSVEINCKWQYSYL